MARKKTKKKSGQIRIGGRFAIPYPLFIFIMLAAGVILMGWTAAVVADAISVRAKVAAAPLTQPALILTPADGSILTSKPINVSGICPLGSYVELFRNNVFSGSVLCSADGTFQMASDLFMGVNKLQAKDFNTTDDQGPASSIITVTYYPPEPSNPVTPPAGKKTPPPDNKKFILNTNGKFEYSGYFVGQTVTLQLTAGGGTPPYVFNIDWGDNDPQITVYKDGPFTISHTYSRSGEFRGSHTITVAGRDSKGRRSFLQLFVIVNSKSSASLGAPTRPIIRPPSVLDQSNWLWVAWPAYGIVLLMSISYVLGEREELFIIRHRRQA